ncbi:MAG: hypothetical protein RL076_152 [Chloroflexota bacterium]|jgi:DNA-binding transcriptional LysR family regulator
MDVQQLRIFVEVATHLHVSKAAQTLHLAQPAVSRAIRELEHDCGDVALIQKVGRNIRLTEAGEVLLGHAHRILAEVTDAQMSMQARSHATAGRVRIGAPPTIGQRLLPPALARFRALHPAVELRIEQGGTSQLLTHLDLGEIDIAVVTMPIPTRNHHIELLFDEPLVVVMHRTHALAHHTQIALSALSDESFLLYPPVYEMHNTIIAACKTAGFTPKIALDGGDVGLLLELAAAGLGVAIVPQLAIRGNEEIVARPLSAPKLTRQMALIQRSDRASTVASRTLFAALARDLRMKL